MLWRGCEVCDTIVSTWARLCNHWGGRSALDCGCVGEEMDTSFVWCREEVDYERQMVKLSPCMHKIADSLGDKPHLDNIVVSLQLGSVWFVNGHE